MSQTGPKFSTATIRFWAPNIAEMNIESWCTCIQVTTEDLQLESKSKDYKTRPAPAEWCELKSHPNYGGIYTACVPDRQYAQLKRTQTNGMHYLVWEVFPGHTK
jgi:hypothetical protein